MRKHIEKFIEIDGEEYKTLPVKVIITAAVDKPNDPNNVDHIADENIHLVAEVSKSNPYLNEAITVVYKLYVKKQLLSIGRILTIRRRSHSQSSKKIARLDVICY